MITIRHEPRYLTYVQQNSPMPYQYNQVALELYTETSKYRLFITNADRHAVGLFCFLLVWRFAGFSLNSRKITKHGSICMCMRLRIWLKVTYKNLWLAASRAASFKRPLLSDDVSVYMCVRLLIVRNVDAKSELDMD